MRFELNYKDGKIYTKDQNEVFLSLPPEHDTRIKNIFCSLKDCNKSFSFLINGNLIDSILHVDVDENFNRLLLIMELDN